MEVWVLVLFLAGEKIEPPGNFADKDACIAAGKQEVETYKQYHKHSKAWFWCVRGRDA